jgi:uncharacterized protein (DUF433 family)
VHLLIEGVFMEWRDRITSDPAVLVGKPVIKGTRISVELILGWLANGWTYEQLLEAYPHITREDILASLSFSEEMLRDEDYVPPPEIYALGNVL